MLTFSKYDDGLLIMLIRLNIIVKDVYVKLGY